MPARCADQKYFYIQDLRPVMSMCWVNIRKDLTQMALLELVIALVPSTVIRLSVRRISPPSGRQSKPLPISPVAKAT